MKLLSFLICFANKMKRNARNQRDIRKAMELIELMTVSKSLQAGRR